jgi:hypothetical protein
VIIIIAISDKDMFYVSYSLYYTTKCNGVNHKPFSYFWMLDIWWQHEEFHHHMAVYSTCHLHTSHWCRHPCRERSYCQLYATTDMDFSVPNHSSPHPNLRLWCFQRFHTQIFLHRQESVITYSEDLHYNAASNKNVALVTCSKKNVSNM